MRLIAEDDFIASVADALQYISYYHPPDFIRHMAAAYEIEESPAARDAIGQILANSRMAALGHRPLCQDTGVAMVFVKLGMEARIDSRRPLQDLVDQAARQAYRFDANPLRASVVVDPLFSRKNSGDNTPAVVHVELVEGDTCDVIVAAKGFGSENKARFAVLNPSDSVVDWVLDQVSQIGAGWCPPGVLGIGVGGTAEKAMLLAKQALMQPLDMTELRRRGPESKIDELRIEILDRVNALGVGAQGLGGLVTALDVKIETYPTHAASLPVAMIPNCAATRHLHFTLDGSGTAELAPPDLSDWPEIALAQADGAFRHVDLNTLDQAEIDAWAPGDRLLLSGTLYTGRDAAHKRMVDMIARGEALPVDLRGKAIYYVGPVDAIEGEAVGPAGPTTSNRMDRFLEALLPATGLKVMVGKAERGAEAARLTAEHKAAYLIAVGGAAYLVSKAIKSARKVAFEDLGMEAIHVFEVERMPVMVGIDSQGRSIHEIGPARWRRALV